MLLTERERIAEEIRALAERLGPRRTSLVPILQEVRRRHGRIDGHAMQVVADQLGLHPVEVYGVVSFYAFLGDRPQGQFVIRLCRTVSCEMEGKARVARQLENELGIAFGETTPDGKFTLEWASCMGLCDQGPALLVNEEIHARVTPESVHEIVGACRRTFGVHAVEGRP